VRKILERLLPSRLGPGFRWVVASSWISNLGDGFALSAGPLLVASQTHDPTLVALATLLQRLPWLLFALAAGVLADQRNRAAIVAAADLLRGALLAALAILIITGHVNIGLVLTAMLLLGTAEVFSNTASAALLPLLVHRDDLTLANSRLQAGFVAVFQLAGPPLGAVLFAAGVPYPFVGQAILVSLGAVLITQVRRRAVIARESAARRVGAEIVEGFRWVRSNAAVRTLVLTILVFNITFGAAWSVLVLYAKERLGMDAVGFGLLTTAAAIGGLAGTTAYGWITQRISLFNLMRVGLIVETFTHLGLALTTQQVVALGIMVAFGAHAFIWGTTSVTVRQRAVPHGLQGRVASIYALATFGGIVAGSALGGPIASRWGITAPFWFACVGSAAFVILIWRELSHIARQEQSAVPS
jgi:MFS family permease